MDEHDLINYIARCHDDDITCDQCFESVDLYLEALHSGQPLDDALEQVRRHIENCPCCRAEMQAFELILRGQQNL